MFKKSITHYAAKILVDIMFFAGIGCIMTVPFLGGMITRYFGYGQGMILVITYVLLSSGICAVYILHNLRRMFKTLLGGDPFIQENVSCFRKMAVSCGLISLIYIIKWFFIRGLATLVLIVAFAIACLFCLTLKDIFKQAVWYKEENDLTI